MSLDKIRKHPIREGGELPPVDADRSEEVWIAHDRVQLIGQRLGVGVVVATTAQIERANTERADLVTDAGTMVEQKAASPVAEAARQNIAIQNLAVANAAQITSEAAPISTEAPAPGYAPVEAIAEGVSTNLNVAAAIQAARAEAVSAESVPEMLPGGMLTNEAEGR